MGCCGKIGGRGVKGWFIGGGVTGWIWGAGVDGWKKVGVNWKFEGVKGWKGAGVDGRNVEFCSWL